MQSKKQKNNFEMTLKMRLSYIYNVMLPDVLF